MSSTLTVSQRITRERPFKLCFVCLGNICRSPTAEGVFSHLVRKHELQSYFEIDSAGTSAYHIGDAANSKSRQTAEKHGIELLSRARRFESADLDYYDLVLAMDTQNYSDIHQLDPRQNYADKILKLRDFDPQPGNGDVPDPYYGGLQGFENVFQIVYRSCENLLDQLKPHIDRS